MGKKKTGIYRDDGVSGIRFDRPGFMAMMEEVESGNVEAINDNVDTSKGNNDFTPFLNIMYEFYARNTSRKIKSVFKAKGMSSK